MVRKARIVPIAAIMGVIVLGLVLLRQHWGAERAEMLARCADYEEETRRVILDCYGIISIINSNSTAAPSYIIKDNKHDDRTLAAIDSFRQFKVVGGKLYVIDQQPGKCFDNLKQQYCLSYYVDGELELFNYDKIEDIPIHLIIDTTNGNVQFYKTAEEAPEEARSIFFDLENA